MEQTRLDKFCTVLLLTGLVFGFEVLLLTPADAQIDIPISGINTYLSLSKGGAWGVSGSSGINNNFLYTPITADAAVCVYVTNNNPTNGHPVTVSLFQTGDPNSKTYIGNTGRWNAVPIMPSASFPVTIAASTTQGFFYRTSASALVNVQLSGSTALGGSPDTADLYIVQTTQNNCGLATSGNSVVGPTPNGVAIANQNNSPVVVGGYSANTQVARTAAVDPTSGGWGIGTPFTALPLGITSGAVSPSADANRALATVLYDVSEFGNTLDPVNGTRVTGVAISDATSYHAYVRNTSWFVSSDSVNPGAGAEVLGGVGFGTTRSYWRHLQVSCSAACDFIVNKISTAGTTCTAVTPGLMQGVVAVTAVFNKLCTGLPTVAGQVSHYYMAANTSQTIDVTGFGSVANNSGIEVVMGGALVGTISVSMDGYDR